MRLGAPTARPVQLLQLLLFVSGLSFTVGTGAQNNPGDLMLVSSTDQVAPLSSLDLRKLFLGLPITQEGQQLQAVIYQPDSEMRDIFLKTVVGMTSRSFERKVLQARLSFGARIVPTYRSKTEVVEALQEKQLVVSFMPFSDAQFYELEVVQTLWHAEN